MVYAVFGPASIAISYPELKSAMDYSTEESFIHDFSRSSRKSDVRAGPSNSDRPLPENFVTSYPSTEQEVPTTGTSEGESTATLFDDGLTWSDIDMWFTQSANRTSLPSASIQDQSPPGDLQAYRHAPKVPDPEQGAAVVQSSTGPTDTIPEVQSYVTTSYMLPPTIIGSAVMSHSSSQLFPSGYAMSPPLRYPGANLNVP